MSLSSPPSFDEYPPSFDEPPSFDDVGIAARIAKKKKYDQQLQKERESHRIAPAPSSPTTRRTHSSLKDFLYGISLYILCLSLPTLLGTLTAQFYQEQQSVPAYYYEQMSDYLCRNGLWWTYGCRRRRRHHSPFTEDDSTITSLQAPDTEWTDVGIIAILSLSLAMLRLALVHLLVPRYLAPRRLEALVRCKSVHLLSSSYPNITLTPPSTRRRKQGQQWDTIELLPPLTPAPIVCPLFEEDSTMDKKESKWRNRVKNVWQRLQRYVTYCMQYIVQNPKQFWGELYFFVPHTVGMFSFYCYL